MGTKKKRFRKREKELSAQNFILKKALVRAAVPLEVLYMVEHSNPTLSPTLREEIAQATINIRATLTACRG